MSWKTVRLELAENGEFPNGSASRAYLMRLPLGTDDRIDEQAFLALPERATVRRLWPSEADMSGHLVRRDGHWAVIARNGEVIGDLDPGPVRIGETVRLRERGQDRWFRVAALSELERRPSL